MRVSREPSTPNTGEGGHATPVVLTPKALVKVKSEQGKAELAGHALRLAVIGGGCSGFQYEMDFSKDERPGDVVIEQDGLRIVIDERSALYLSGTTIDYVDGFGSGGFKFVNPNAKKTCGCGESFSAES